MTTTSTDEHLYRVEQEGAQFRRACSCGFSTRWQGVWRSGIPEIALDNCPKDPTVRSLITLQFSRGGLFDGKPTDNLVHLVRSTNGGTPGPTLCGIDRFAQDCPGWSVGGGLTGPDIHLKPCDECADTAESEYPGLPVRGSVGGREMAEHIGVAHANH